MDTKESMEKIILKLEKMEADITANREECRAIKKVLVEDKKIESKPTKSILDVLKGFMDSSTMHGLPNISSAKHVWIRLFWMLFLLAGFTVSGWQLFRLFSEFFTFPVLTEVKVHHGNLTYPDVTVCNHNEYLGSRIVTHPVLSSHPVFNRAFQSTSDFIKAMYNLSLEIDMLPEEERIALGYNASDFILAYNYDDAGNSLDPPKLFYHRTYGNCYTIKPLVQGNKSNDVYITTNMNVNEYLDPWKKHGVDVYLAEPGTSPFSRPSHKITLKPAQKLYVEVSLEVINRLNGSFENCQDNEAEFEQETGLVYTQDVCLERCRVQNVAAKCGCIVHHHVVFPERFKFHSLYPRFCENDETDACDYYQAYHKPDCSCKPQCHTKAYKLITKKSKMKNVTLEFKCRNWPACVGNNTEDEDGFYTIMPWQTEWAASNLAEVHMKFTDLLYKEFSEVPVYSVWRFMSDLGGTLGLYLGISILTLLEILQCIIGVTLFLFFGNGAIN